LDGEIQVGREREGQVVDRMEVLDRMGDREIEVG